MDRGRFGLCRAAARNCCGCGGVDQPRASAPCAVQAAEADTVRGHPPAQHRGQTAETGTATAAFITLSVHRRKYMLLYDSIGPNPKVVRTFIAERGITGIETQNVDLMGGENRREPYLSKNPSGTLPAL